MISQTRVSRNAIDNFSRLYVFGDYGACPNKGTFSNSDAGADHRSPADGAAALEYRRHKSAFWPDFGPGVFVVGECHVGANENVVLDTQAIPKVVPALHGHVVTHDHVIFDKAVTVDVAIRPDRGARQNYRELPDVSARADIVRLAISKWVNFWHRFPHLLASAAYPTTPPTANARLS